jgi:hypothetical protein
VTFSVVVLGALLALLVPLVFVAGLKLGVLKSSSKLEAATSTLKAAEAVSAIAQSAATRAAQDWTLGQRLEKLERMEQQTKSALSSLVAVSDRMDVTLAKVAEWTVMAPGRKRLQHQSPVDLFVDRTRSALPTVPSFDGPEEMGVATLAGPTERGQP